MASQAPTQSPNDIFNMVNDFLIDRPVSLAKELRDKLREIVRPGALPPPIAVRDLAEFIYYKRDEMPPEILAIGVQATNLLIMFQQFGFAAGRGIGIVSELYRQEGMDSSMATEGLEAPEPDPLLVNPPSAPGELPPAPVA